jgi:hypothetical protein
MIVAVVAPCAGFEVVVQEQFQLNESQFNQWVFGGNRGIADPEVAVALATEAVSRVCQLTEAQQDKLRLAGRGDYARFNQRVAQVRAQFVDKSYDHQEVGKIYEQIQPLNATYQAGLLGPSSLFAKVARGMLTTEQLQKYNAEQAERLRVRHDAKVRLFIAMLERRVPLTDQQRSALVDLLLTETRPPMRASTMDWQVVEVQAAYIPEERFHAILDEDQFRILEKTLRQARSLEPHLKQQGLLPDH